MNNDKKYALFCQMMDELDAGVSLINEYDSLLHDYGGVIMFQAESQLIKSIGEHPGITASELAKFFGKTASACSQLIRKLKHKGWVIQERNENNSREYNLTLTAEGKEIYERHQKFENFCYQRAFDTLSDVSTEEIESYIKIQKHLNTAFALDVSESKKL